MASTISKKLNYLDIRTLFRFWYTRKFSNVTYVHQKNKEENVHIKLPKFRQMDGTAYEKPISSSYLINKFVP